MTEPPRAAAADSAPDESTAAHERAVSAIVDPLTSRRDAYIAAGLSVLAPGALLGVIGELLRLIEALQNEFVPAGYVAARALSLIAAVTLLAAFTAAAAAMFGSREQRDNRLARVTAIAAVGFAVAFVGSVTEVVTDASNEVDGTGIAAGIAGAISAAAFIALAVAAFAAFSGPSAAAGALHHPQTRRLGVASITLGVAYVFDATSAVLQAIWYGDLGATGGLTTGIWIAVAGSCLFVAAAVLASVALFTAGEEHTEGFDQRRARRDALLAIASGIFAGGALTGAIGTMIAAGSFKENGFGGKEVAATWLTAFSTLALGAAATCIMVGLLSSRSQLGRTRGAEGRAS